MTDFRLSRRAALAGLTAATLVPAISLQAAQAGLGVPPIGMGTWVTFSVPEGDPARETRAEVLKTFFEMGGRMVDSSPMYGYSEDVIGHARNALGQPDNMFTATKIWTPLAGHAENQMRQSEALWKTGETPFDLVYVHNLLNWEAHLETLRGWKAQGRIRRLGVTTSHGRRHDLLEEVMKSESLDAVQLSYNILDRDAERRLLPLARERGLPVIINRPFRTGALFDRFARHSLPGFAAELGIKNWAQYFLKFVISHEAIACAIPATSRVDHMRENMGALTGELPDAATRQKMIDYVEAL